MATVLEVCTNEEHHAVVRSVWAKGLNAKILIKKCSVFTVRSVCRVKRFTTGSRNSLKDVRKEQMMKTRPSFEIATEATVQQVEVLIRADRRITIDSVATALGCSHGLAYSQMHDHWKFREVYARWVPRELKNRLK
jgi:hypothetical protein